MSDKCKCSKGGACCGGFSIWFVGWLFAIGFLGLSFWKGVWAILLWPYYIGVYIQSLMK